MSHPIATVSNLVSPNSDPVTMVAIARRAFNSGKTKSLNFRRRQLQNLRRVFVEHKSAFARALQHDLGRHRQEAFMFDIDPSIFSIDRTLQHLTLWCALERPARPLVNLLDEVEIINDPYGVVLVMGAWNFPLNLVFVPVAGAIAAGNCVIMKPSEIASATAQLVEHLIPQYMDRECFHVLNGGIQETTELLRERFDYIFFTGSTNVGKVVHAAANKHLTPVTLELGGKSPVYLDDTVDIEVATRRILWGKCSNAGQLCLAADYLLCTKKVRTKFLTIAKVVFKEWYGTDVKRSSSCSRIVSKRHYDRLVSFLQDGTIALGGKTDPSQRFIEPTILIDICGDDRVMQEEIFGPILPIIIVNSEDEAIDFIDGREKPLALYIFSNNKKTVDLFLNNTFSGGVTVNDTLMHFDVETMPFGGVGFSGMGAYHGKFTFDAFVHKKSVLSRSLNLPLEKLISSRYPPNYDSGKKQSLFLSKSFVLIYDSTFKYLLFIIFGIISVVVTQMMYLRITGKRLL